MSSVKSQDDAEKDAPGRDDDDGVSCNSSAPTVKTGNKVRPKNLLHGHDYGARTE